MKRLLVLGCALLALGATVPSRADTTTIAGYVETAAVSPSVPRTLYLANDDLNGHTGFVARIDPVAEERPFTLRNLIGPDETGAEDLDVWFYRDISGTGDPCPRQAEPTSDGGEAGTMCGGAGWVVVVLFAGANASFRLTY